MNLTCHLESADSVRHNPSGEFSERHFVRLFAEAFTHLLFGEQLRFGQTPIYDSYGLAWFISEFLEARADFERESLAEFPHLPQTLPLVMTHYAGVRKGHEFSSSNSVLRETLANKIGDLKLENSALPNVGNIPDIATRLSQELELKGIRINEFSEHLLRDLESWPDELAHLRRLETIDRYFLSNQGTVTPNNERNMVKLWDAVAESLKEENVVQDPRFSDVVKFYERLVTEIPQKKGLGRSLVYSESRKEFEDPERMAIARELADSLYMWNEARMAGAVAETTSSGVESDSDQVRLDGEAISDWADRSKERWAGDTSNGMDIRPVIQRGPLGGSNSLTNPSYRSKLLTALAELSVQPDFHELRMGAMGPAGHQQGHIQEFWEDTIGKIRGFEKLDSLINLTITSTGVIRVKFGCHQLGAMAQGISTTPETSDQIKEALDRDEQGFDSNGAQLKLE